ncbi:diacylglycerol kinase [Streptomyces sp. NPDC093085]|uniref:diacylglycerol kinase n=1 Tax=Streptomyces sp. NPDC093085 TaxID=3155068 RepID=UPI00343378A8
MSAPEPAENGAQQLLVVIDPVSGRIDGESVRIARDVLSGGAAVKICFPEGPEELARALSRRGSRRPVLVGDDRALLRMVSLLHRERELTAGALSLVPVGPSVELARSLGVPTGAVAAARAVLDGVVRRLDLLVDDSDGVVLGHLHIPGHKECGKAKGRMGRIGRMGGEGGMGVSGDAEDAEGVESGYEYGHGYGYGSGTGASGAGYGTGSGAGVASVWHTCRSFVRTLVRPAPGTGAGPTGIHRLRVEADGVVLSDLDEPVEAVTVRSRGGRAQVEIRTQGAPEPRTASALSVTVSGADFRYRADARVAGPVRTRTWTLRPGAWGLTLPVGTGGGSHGGPHDGSHGEADSGPLGGRPGG